MSYPGSGAWWRLCVCACLSICTLASPSLGNTDDDASPDDVVPQFYAFTPFYLDADDDRGVDEGAGVRFVYGRQLAPHWYWETDGHVANLNTPSANTQDFYQQGLSTGISWSLYERNNEQWTPYLLGALGIARNDVLPDRNDDTSLTASLALGAVSASLLDNGTKLRAEARYLHDRFEGNFGDWHLNLGIEIPLGQTREKVVYVKETVEVPVEKVVEKEVPLADSDGDSVPDKRDQCPNTLPNARVDATGCIIESQTLTLREISFETNSAQLTTSAKNALQPVVQSLKGQSDYRVEIAGHTDSVGPEDYNLKLSRERAESVMTWLVEQGVDPERLTAKGYGELEPVASNETASGRAMNRRVEFRLAK
jgi:OOP family OmpA-OmpF porin